MAATPREELEHWAAREIDRLRAELADMTTERDLHAGFTRMQRERAEKAEAELAQANALLRDTRAAVVVLRNMLANASLRGGIDAADNMLARIDARLGGEHV